LGQSLQAFLPFFLYRLQHFFLQSKGKIAQFNSIIAQGAVSGVELLWLTVDFTKHKCNSR